MNFIETQQAFMDYIRDPSNPLPAGIEQRRMTIYRELFFNNINGFVSSAFPVLKSLYQDDQWLALVQTFFNTHQCETPIFVEIAGEFLHFLQHEYQPKDNDPVFLLELAHYEWLELAVAVAQTKPSQLLLTESEVATSTLALSTTAKVAQYRFDVQHISVDYQPIEPPANPHYFCVFLNQQEEVTFLQLNPLSAQVLAYIEQQSSAGHNINFDEITHWLQTIYPQMAADVLTSGCLQLLQQLASQGIVVTK